MSLFIQCFLESIENLKANGNFKLELVSPFCWILNPANARQFGGPRDVPVTVLALVHGDERCGVDVLNEFLRLILNGTIEPKFSVGIALGNVPAAMKNVRYRDQDLNRSFGTEKLSNSEDRRAKEIEQLLKRSMYLVDLHQTITRSDFPFFIFGYAERTAAFANLLCPDLPLVTFLSGQFSCHGKTTIDYMRSSGGTALTLEMGQIGFDRYQRDVGVLTLIRALNCVQQLTFGGASLVLNRSNFSNEIYTFAETIQADDSLAKLDDGWYNFRELSAGERLGTQSTGEIKAAQDGWMLFPKYSLNESARSLSTSKVTKVELGRILRRSSPEELPQDIC